MTTPSVGFNVVDGILYQCRMQPPAAALCAPGAQIPLVSYGRLQRYIHHVSRKLAVFGLAPGEIAALDVHEPVLHVALALALTRLGLATVSVRGSVPTNLGAAAMLSDRSVPPLGARQTIPVDLSWIEGDGTPVAPSEAARAGGDNPCRIILTSGTTGTPKAVAVSHRLLLDRIGRHLNVFGSRLPDCSRIYCDLSLPTSLGFQFLIYTLLRGGTFFFGGERFQDTLAALEQYKAQALIASPGGLESLLRVYDDYPLYQSKFDVVFSGGDLLSKSLSLRVRSRLSTHLISAYGSTEASITASAPSHAVADTRGAVGYVMPGVTVEVLDDAGRALPPGSDGLLRIRSAFAVDRYLSGSDDPESPFRDGWFYPGDIGSVSPEGLLVITGRQKSVLNIGGSKVGPETIEGALSGYDGIDECAAFGVPNKLGNEEIWIALVANAKFNEQRLREYCQTVLPVHLMPQMFVLVDELTRNAMGKIERERIKELAIKAPDGGLPI